MSLVFTDTQLKDLTKGVLNAPANILAAQADQAAMVAQKAKLLVTDQGNETYTNNWLNIIARYHEELKYLNGVTHTNYDSAAIQPAGKLTQPNIHFNPPTWVKFQPQLHASNNGIPIGAWANTETEAIDRANLYLDYLKNGFTDGAANTTATTGFVVDEIDVTSAVGLAAGNRVLFISGSNFLLGTIDTIVGLKLKIIIILSSGGFPGILTGATVANFHVGFSLAQRDAGTGANAGDVAYQAALKVPIDTAIADWKTRLNAEKTELLANDATGTEATEITNAKNLVNGHITTITTWQSFPAIGVGTGRFGTNLPPLEVSLANRPAQITSRITEITTALGSVSQLPDGTYSGSGNYFKLFDNLNLRLNIAGGSLRSYYDADLGVQALAQIVVNLQNQKIRDEATFNVKSFTADADGTNVIKVNTITGLIVTDAVKIMSNSQAVLSAVITGIAGLNVTLDITIPNTYTVADLARLSKQS
jgi:hypothetical protein